jgi:hypothetical protein
MFFNERNVSFVSRLRRDVAARFAEKGSPAPFDGYGMVKKTAHHGSGRHCAPCAEFVLHTPKNGRRTRLRRTAVQSRSGFVGGLFAKGI